MTTIVTPNSVLLGMTLFTLLTIFTIPASSALQVICTKTFEPSSLISQRPLSEMISIFEAFVI